MADSIRVNGNLHSWGSIVVKAQNERLHGFTAIKYADKRERSKAYGMGRHHAPRGRSRGKYSTEPCTLTGYPGSIQRLRETLAALAPDGNSYGDVVFQIVVQYIESDDTAITVEIEDCVWTGNSTSNEEGSDSLSEEIEIDPMRIRRNGKVLYDETEGTP